jgi:hypothetical protein
LRKRVLERGVAGGEREAGRGGGVFVENAGDFRLIIETRPYMRPRAPLAAALASARASA